MTIATINHLGQVISTTTKANRIPKGFVGFKKSNSPKDNVGKKVSFSKGTETITGEIRGIMFDKRVNLEYYRIVSATGKVYHIRTSRKDLF